MASMGAGDNTLLQLAMFQTLFNTIGVLIFWPWQAKLEQLLCRFLPERKEPEILIQDTNSGPRTAVAQRTQSESHARYLSESALASVDTASRAAVQELQHLGRLSLEVICHALYQPIEQLSSEFVDEERLNALPNEYESLDIKGLYKRHIKVVYSELLGFMSRVDTPMDKAQQQFWVSSQMAALQLVDAVKDAKSLQKNLGRYLQDVHSPSHKHYLKLRSHLLWVLRQVYEVSRLELPDDMWRHRLDLLVEETTKFENKFSHTIFSEVRSGNISNLQVSSLMHDLRYSSRIRQSFENVLRLGLTDDNELLREFRNLHLLLLNSHFNNFTITRKPFLHI